MQVFVSNVLILLRPICNWFSLSCVSQ